jgi:excisionase family DNA binding protein
MSADALLDALAAEIAQRVVAHLESRLPHPTPPQAPLAPAQYLTTRQAAALLACGRSTLENFRAHGKGPRWIKIGGAVRYAREDLLTWAAAHARGPKK